MTETFDALIIGGGHNGLVCAGRLARAGQKVLVLERSTRWGGAAATEELAPGFRTSSCAHIDRGLHPRVIEELELATDGEASPLKTFALTPEGPSLCLEAGEVTGDLSGEDKKAYDAFSKQMARYASLLSARLSEPPLTFSPESGEGRRKLAKLGWDLRVGLGREDLRELLRIITMPIHGLVDEHFESEALKALVSFDATLGTTFEPRMPSTVFTYLYRLATEYGAGATLPKGGMGAIGETLAAAARDYGAILHDDTEVDHILVEKGRAVGVVTARGNQFRADQVISNADPKRTLLGLLGARYLEAGFARRVQNFRAKGRTAKVNLALRHLPEVNGLRPEDLAHRLVLAPSRRFLELAFNPTKYGEVPEAPALEVVFPSLADPGLTDGDGEVLSALVQYAPTVAKAPGAGEAMLQNVLSELETLMPGLGDLVVASEVLLPEDLEARFAMTGGSWHHGDLALDQFMMMRPLHGAARYQMPVDGLSLCGAGTHPGGGVNGLAGLNAAMTLLQGDRS